MTQPDEAYTPQLAAFRAAAARFKDAGQQLDGVTPFGWFLAGMGAVDLGAPFDPALVFAYETAMRVLSEERATMVMAAEAVIEAYGERDGEAAALRTLNEALNHVVPGRHIGARDDA